VRPLQSVAQSLRSWASLATDRHNQSALIAGCSARRGKKQRDTRQLWPRNASLMQTGRNEAHVPHQACRRTRNQHRNKLLAGPNSPATRPVESTSVQLQSPDKSLTQN